MPKALYRHTRRGEGTAFAAYYAKGVESARVCGARIFLSLCKRFVRVDFDIFNLYFNVIISNYITFARQTLTQLKLTVRYPDISSKSKGHQNRCPLLLELFFSAGAFVFSACFYSPLRLSICFLFFYPLLCSLIRFAANSRKLTHRVS